MTHQVIMPDLGQTTAEGKILRWLKEPGSFVAKGDALLEVETDKVTMEVESSKSGYLRALLVEQGQMASAMSAIAVLTDTLGEAYQGATGPNDDVSRSREPKPEIANPDLSGSRRSFSSLFPFEPSRRPIATPAAKARSRDLGIPLDRVVGTGPGGLITRRDVEAASEKLERSTAALPMAAITAQSAAAIPHFYATADVTVSHMIQWRERWNASHPELHASVNDIFVRAAALALNDVPNLNVRYREGRMEQRRTADILLVVAIHSGMTLVPIQDPAASSWESYLKHMRLSLSGARANRVRSSFETVPALAISNLGMFGVKQFTALIPPGSAAALAVGAIREEVVVKDRQMRIEEVCSLTLSSDHRVIDGVTAAQFLQRMQAHLDAL